jgi:hypothetical protein
VRVISTCGFGVWTIALAITIEPIAELVDGTLKLTCRGVWQAELASAREDSEAASEEAQRLKGNVSELRARLTSLTHQLGEARRGVQSAHEALRRARERELREEMAAER